MFILSLIHEDNGKNFPLYQLLQIIEVDAHYWGNGIRSESLEVMG